MNISNIYEMTRAGLQPASETGKTDLQPGRKITLQGYSNPSYYITRKIPTDFGLQYEVVNPETLTYSRKEVFALKFIDEKRDNRIQLYIMPESDSIDGEELASLIASADAALIAADAAAKEKAEDLNKNLAKGKALFDAQCPKVAKALVIAEYEVDESDTMTDYFHQRREQLHVLSWSAHTRDLFSEMRKHAGNFSGTEHLAAFNRGDERREKHSMGKGFYLKHGYGDGWTVSKLTLIHNLDDVYLAFAAGRTHLTG